MKTKNKILVINAGSSSIKFQLFSFITEAKQPVFTIICRGIVERIGIKDSNFSFSINHNGQFVKKERTKDIVNHVAGAQIIINALIEYEVITSYDEINKIGHRIVHGGEKFVTSTIIDQTVIAEIEACVSLAPLHNPPALKGLAAFQTLIPHAKHVAVFDTAFHATLPKEKYLYPVPYEWYQNYFVRRYGFHGISYRYILHKLTGILNKQAPAINAIVCHLGNGASICVIKNGKSFNTSMGLTPLDGLIMGTRSGIIDPAIPSYLCRVKPNTTIDSITNDLNKVSGLLGISQYSSDLRDIITAYNDDKHQHHKSSKLAIKMFVQSITSYILQYANDLNNNIDALVFTAGIGENSAFIRQLIVDEIAILKLALTSKNNTDKYEDYLQISTQRSQIPIYKIRTNEEIIICQDTYNLLINC